MADQLLDDLRRRYGLVVWRKDGWIYRGARGDAQFYVVPSTGPDGAYDGLWEAGGRPGPGKVWDMTCGCSEPFAALEGLVELGSEYAVEALSPPPVQVVQERGMFAPGPAALGCPALAALFGLAGVLGLLLWLGWLGVWWLTGGAS